MSKSFEWADRLKQLPPYLFAEIDRAKTELRRKKISFIDLSIGDPDIPAPEGVLKKIYAASKLKENQKYALDMGKAALRDAIKKWMKKRFSVALDSEKEILPLIGSKEGLVHFPLGFAGAGDYVLIPSPGYPGYRASALFAGARSYEMPLLEKNAFLPELKKIPAAIRNKSKIMFLNYPNNPTTALAPRSFLEDAVRFCSKYGIILAYDNAYSEIYFDKKPLSILEIKGAEEVSLEFHSFSKTFCMTGFRIGWACGSAHLVNTLLKVKTNIDSGVWGAIQEGGIYALEKEEKYTQRLRATFAERRNLFVAGLEKKGFEGIHADSAFYVWVRIPAKYSSSIKYAAHLLKDKNIVATPGLGFGLHGEGFIRFALTTDIPELKKALQKL
ncbi:aminotransferase class I/II-fold pyridoxal phosphate-dependent enzyme [bacterium]|nr:aminotransferase class I/II-fold pyridoxal phosphate-dependent enzyme [bacterium]